MSKAIFVGRALKFSRLRDRRQEAASGPDKREAKMHPYDGWHFLELFAGTCPLARGFLRQAPAIQRSAFPPGGRQGGGEVGASSSASSPGSNFPVYVQCVDWTGTDAHEPNRLPLDDEQLKELGGWQNLVQEDTLNIPLHNIDRFIRRSPPRYVRAVVSLSPPFPQITTGLACRTITSPSAPPPPPHQMGHGKKDRRQVDQVHIAFECTTISLAAQELNQR